MTEVLRKRLGLRNAGAISIGLRVLLLAGKFLFMVFLARMTTPATVGVYALFVTTITISIFVVGGELHTYTTREVVKSDDTSEQGRHFQNHLRFVALTTACSLPFLWIALSWLKIGSQISFPLLAVILYGEVFCQELGRYLMILSRPIASNFLQVIRNAAWMPFAVVLMHHSAANPIHAIQISWAVGCWAAAAYGLWSLRALMLERRIFTWNWLKIASSSARHYYIVVIVTQLQSYADRFIIQYQLGEKQVGMLAFYQSFANIVQGFVQTGVIMILLPQLLLAVHEENSRDVVKTYKRMMIIGIGMAVAIAVMMWVVMMPILEFVGKSAYLRIFNIFIWLLVGNIFLVAAQVSHLHLYAMHEDKLLMHVSLATLLISLLADLVMIPLYGVNGAVGVFAVMAVVQYLLKARLRHGCAMRRNQAYAT